jgi:hypothetical protein
MKRRLAGIFLLFCFVAPLAAGYLFLKHQKKEVRRAVKWNMIAGLDKEELVLLKFTENETQTKLLWKHAKEFQYDGEMYDIVESSSQGDSIFYWCWWDFEETKLNKQLDQLLAFVLGNNQERKSNQEQITNFYKSLYWERFTSNWNSITQASEPEKQAEFSYLSISSQPPVPPPEKA